MNGIIAPPGVRMLAILESPFRGTSPTWVPWPFNLIVQRWNTWRNRRYAYRCMRDSIGRGEAPLASHLAYTQCLNDNVPWQRTTGMECGFSWGYAAHRRVVYCDLGVSPGMYEGIRCRPIGQPIEYRYLDAGLRAKHKCEICGDGVLPREKRCPACRHKP